MSWDFEKFVRELGFLGDLLERRVESLKTEMDITPLIRLLDVEKARDTAREYFGSGEYYALGIDGSMDHRERLEVVVLYISIAGFKCRFSVGDTGEIDIDLDSIERDGKYTASAIIPLWFEDINEVLRQYEIGLTRSIEAAIEGIPFSIMTFGEFYLGYRAARDNDDIRIITYDRPFASSIHPFQRDLRRIIFREKGGFFTKFSYDGVRLTKADLLLGLYLGPNIYNIPFRGAYKVYSVIQHIIREGGKARLSELEKKFGVGRDKIIKALEKLDMEALDKTLLDEVTSTEIILNPGVLGYWDKIRRLIDIVGVNIFMNPRGRHPLYFEESESWIGTKELNSITLFTIYETVKNAIEKRKLIIGIGKDTYVTDITRAILPLTNEMGITKAVEPPVKSDKPLLTMLSALQKDVYRTPWRFIAYDAAFATLSKNQEPGGPVLRAARKVVFQEGIIARSYFQLRSFKTVWDTEVKSPVFFYDRFLYGDEEENRISIKVLERNKRVEIKPFFEKGFSQMDNLILYILSKMDKPEVAEATGHNYLLFLADKDVKASINMIRESVIQAADSKITEIISKKHLFIITRRFRDFRKIVESRRRRR